NQYNAAACHQNYLTFHRLGNFPVLLSVSLNSMQMKKLILLEKLHQVPTCFNNAHAIRLDIKFLRAEVDITKDIFCAPKNDLYYSNLQYSPLKKDGKEIRLLRILPASIARPEDGIMGELLQNIPLNEVQGTYSTLSYCAGSPQNTKRILVNRTECNVFTHLHVALLYCCHFWKQNCPTEGFLLWVDQICIEQPNLDDRCHQVGLMSEIYGSAKQSLISLATEEVKSECIEWAGRIQDVHTSEVRFLEGPESAFKHIREVLKDTADECGRSCLAFFDMLERPWWKRAWVLQEFCLSPTAYFPYGKQFATCQDLYSHTYKVYLAIQMELYKNFVRRLRSSNCTPRHILEPWLEFLVTRKENVRTDYVFILLQQKRWLSEKETINILNLLHRSSFFEASYERDKIYAFLGLVDAKYRIEADYRKPLWQVLRDMTRRITSCEDNLEVLLYLWTRQKFHAHSCSWVVDWRITAREVHLPIGDFSHLPEARADAKFYELAEPINLGLNIALQVWGVHIDSGLIVYHSQNAIITSKGYMFKRDNRSFIPFTKHPLEQHHQLWVIYGSVVPLFLSPLAQDHYRIIYPAVLRELIESSSHPLADVFDKVERGEQQRQRISIL
ncbi:hypothetical protein K469DRAFT_793790, partial [Zopfia rhizophila CBS 207.26]